jgi:hypothetical protein
MLHEQLVFLLLVVKMPAKNAAVNSCWQSSFEELAPTVGVAVASIQELPRRGLLRNSFALTIHQGEAPNVV